MKPTRGRTSHADKLRSNARSEALYAAMRGVPVRSDMPAPPERQERAKRAVNPSGEPLEGDIQRAIIKYLAVHPKVAFVGRFNSGVAVATDAYGNTRYTRYNTIKGFPDIHFLLKGGKAGYCEVKRPGGKLTPDQELFLSAASAAGALAFMATSVMDVEERLK